MSSWAALVRAQLAPNQSYVRAELFYDRGHHHEFLSLSQELAAPGEMRQAQTFDFLFKNVEKQYESYQGINVKLRYADFPTSCVHPNFRIQLLYSGDNIPQNWGGRQGKGSMGTLIPHASRW